MSFVRWPVRHFIFRDHKTREEAGTTWHRRKLSGLLWEAESAYYFHSNPSNYALRLNAETRGP